jgi:hypothetical protein
MAIDDELMAIRPAPARHPLLDAGGGAEASRSKKGMLGAAQPYMADPGGPVRAAALALVQRLGFLWFPRCMCVPKVRTWNWNDRGWEGGRAGGRPGYGQMRYGGYGVSGLTRKQRQISHLRPSSVDAATHAFFSSPSGWPVGQQRGKGRAARVGVVSLRADRVLGNLTAEVLSGTGRNAQES